MKWRVYYRHRRPRSGVVVEAPTAYEAWLAASLRDADGVPVPFAAVRCVVVAP